MKDFEVLKMTLNESYIQVIDNETVTLSRLLSTAFRSMWLVGSHCSVIYFESKQLLIDIDQALTGCNELFDEDMNLIGALERNQKKISEIMVEMPTSLWLCKYLLKMANANFNLIIDKIIKHDAKEHGIPDTDLPINEIMAELNQPPNRAILDESIAQLKGGKTVKHEAFYG